MSEITHCANCGGEVAADKPHQVGDCRPPSPTLTEFLLARIAEEGARLDCGVNSHDGASTRGAPTSSACDCDFREKREWAAKRQIIENAQRAREACGLAPVSEQISASDGPVSAYWRGQDWACRALATIYADHPDYDGRWRP